MGDKMPPGASQGIVAAGPSAVRDGVSAGTQLAGHSPVDFAAVAPCDDDTAAPTQASYALGSVPD